MSTPSSARWVGNAGTCHGAKDGKNGFKLSLRGYDPIYDGACLHRRTWPVVASTLPRRTTVSCCSKRLRPCLIKEGSERKMEEPFYQILREWIAQGCSLWTWKSPAAASLQVVPHNPVIRNIGDLQQLRVIARFEDGKTRVTTRECCGGKQL